MRYCGTLDIVARSGSTEAETLFRCPNIETDPVFDRYTAVALPDGSWATTHLTFAVWRKERGELIDSVILSEIATGLNQSDFSRIFGTFASLGGGEANSLFEVSGDDDETNTVCGYVADDGRVLFVEHETRDHEDQIEKVRIKARRREELTRDKAIILVPQQ